jgi:FAD/FMN-containing dehydrogenase
LFGERLRLEQGIRQQFCQAPPGIELSPPDAVVTVRSEDEIIQVVKLCREYGVALIPSGARSSLEGQINAPQGGVCVDCSEMNAIVDVNVTDMTATVQPGVTREQLNSHLRETGLFFSVDPGANASMGGMAATRASGTNSVRYGTMAGNVKAARWIMADGSVAAIGSARPNRPWVWICWRLPSVQRALWASSANCKCACIRCPRPRCRCLFVRFGG